MFPLLPSRQRREQTSGAYRGRRTSASPSLPALRLSRLEDEGPSHKILVVSPGDASEMVFASALMPLLRARYPRCEISMLCGPRSASIAALIPDVDAIEMTAGNSNALWRGRGALGSFAQSVVRVRKEHFDIAVLLSPEWRATLVATLAGARRRIGHAGGLGDRFLTDVIAAGREIRPVLHELTDLLAPLAIWKPELLRYQLNAAPLSSRRERFRLLLGSRPVSLRPFSAIRGESVDLKQWIRVAVELGRRGFDPLWIGSPSELNAVHRAAGSAAWRYVNKLGGGSSSDAAAAISLSHLFIGHDSSSLHLAGAFGVPVVGVYTPGQPMRRFPQGTGDSVMLSRGSPAGVTSRDILSVVDELPIAPRLQLV